MTAARIPQSATLRVPLQAYLASDHISPATGKTIAITISKNGAAYGNPSGGATNAVEIGSGSYYVDLSTTDTGTIGPLFVKGVEGTIDNIIAIYDVANAHNAGFDGVPNAAAGANAGLPVLSVGATTLAYVVANVTTTATVSGNVGGDVQGKVLGGGASAFTAVGVQADTEQWAGHAVAADANNLPKVNVTDWNGSVVGNLPANFASLVIDGSGRVDLGKWLGTVLAGTVPPDAVFIRSGTAQGGSASTITLDAGANSTTNNFYQNCIVLIRSGTGAGQGAIATSYTAASRVLTINGTWAVNPDSTSVFTLLPFGLISASVSGNVTVGGYVAGQDPGSYVLATPANKLVTTAAGRVDVGLWLGSAVTLDANNLPNVAVKDWNGVAVGALPANFSALVISGGGAVTAGTVGDKTGYSLVATGTDLVTVAGKKLTDALRYIGATSAGKLPSGAGSGQENWLDFAGAAAVDITVDSNGNRTVIVYH